MGEALLQMALLPKKTSDAFPKWRKHLRNVQLELELDSQSKRRRILENRTGEEERMRNVRLAGAADGDLERFILPDGALGVEDVEPVNLELQLFALRELDRV